MSSTSGADVVLAAGSKLWDGSTTASGSKLQAAQAQKLRVISLEGLKDMVRVKKAK